MQAISVEKFLNVAIKVYWLNTQHLRCMNILKLVKFRIERGEVIRSKNYLYQCQQVMHKESNKEVK